jgi:hypothetical protein
MQPEKKSFLTQAAALAGVSLLMLIILYAVVTSRAGAAAAGQSAGAPGWLVLSLLTVAAAWGWVIYQSTLLLDRVVGAGPAPAPKGPAPAPPKPAGPARESAAVQMLAILQRQGRLIDFLQEDLGQYEDAQIGAAVRSVHQGCKQALAEHVELEPILQDDEGAQVSVAAGFDPKEIRLTGNVRGNPPFRGTLRHRGWKVARVELPQLSGEGREEKVVAPAEVELGG